MTHARSPGGENRKLAAIIIADVVGYSRLMGTDESRTLAAMTRHRRDFIDPTVVAYQGRIVNAPGDSLLLEFVSVTNAVRCAIALQKGMHDRTRDEDADRRITLRIGVNIGDIIVQGGAIFGDGVNVAARLETLAEAGGICISRAAYEQVGEATGIAFVDLGPHMMKNIARPIEVYALPASVIATMAPMLTAPVKARRPRTLILASLVSVIVAGVAVVAMMAWRATPPETWQQQLDTALVRAMPRIDDKARAKMVASYAATPTHRAFVLAPNAQSRWSSGEWSTPEEAEDKSLERCQAAANEPCLSIAIDDKIVAADDGRRTARDMPRLHYNGLFNPYWIPGVRLSALRKSDVAGYAAAAAPKAIAYNIRGLVFVVTAAASQIDAETSVLNACNAETSRKDLDGPCLLYAIGNQVVLPERHTDPKSTPADRLP